MKRANHYQGRATIKHGLVGNGSCLAYGGYCKGLSDTCRCSTVPRARAVGVGQASGEETAGGLGAAVRGAGSMGIRGSRVGGGSSGGLIDYSDVGVAAPARWVFQGVGWVERQRLVLEAGRWRRIRQSRGVAGRGPVAAARRLWAWRRVDRHGSSIPSRRVGGARGGAPGSKVSMMIMRPPQLGHG